MADMTDVAAALVTLCAGIIYPNGTGSPSITGDPILIYQGWPNAVQLAKDLKAGKAHVSVFPAPQSRVTATTMGDMEWEEASNDGTSGVIDRELRREQRQFTITVWASCFDKRDPLAKALDAGLSAVTRLTLVDASVATMTYAGSRQSDEAQKASIYRRDLMYAVDYATLQSQAATTIKHTTSNLTGGGFAQAGPTLTINA